MFLSAFLGIHYLMTGFFTPHKWAGFTGGALLVMALGLLFLGLIGDMLARHRIYLEELLYESRCRAGAERSGNSQVEGGSGTPR